MSRVVAFVRRLIAWGQSIIRDPASGDASSARIIALWFAFVAGVVAILGVWLKRDVAATVVALSGGGVGGIMSRTKAGAKDD